MQQCFEHECSGLGNDAFQDCAYEHCADEIGECFPSQAGSMTCEESYDCMVDCDDWITDGSGDADTCTDTDDDGACDVGDTDDDNDGVADLSDPAPLDPDVCGDADGDACDDCSVGTDDFGPLADNDPANDGTDTDGDGYKDNVDACPEDPEDFDGFEDEEGCPDHDNDQDGILDTDDQCPMDPEDLDGFEDENGCPDLDNDQDSVPDTDDERLRRLWSHAGCPNLRCHCPRGLPGCSRRCFTGWALFIGVNWSGWRPLPRA